MDLTPIFPGGENGDVKILNQLWGYWEVRIAPTFVPARSDRGDDQRDLSAMLQRCGIVGAYGKYAELFPDKAPT